MLQSTPPMLLLPPRRQPPLLRTLPLSQTSTPALLSRFWSERRTGNQRNIAQTRSSCLRLWMPINWKGFLCVMRKCVRVACKAWRRGIGARIRRRLKRGKEVEGGKGRRSHKYLEDVCAIITWRVRRMVIPRWIFHVSQCWKDIKKSLKEYLGGWILNVCLGRSTTPTT